MAQYRIEKTAGQPAYLQLYVQLRKDITGKVYQFGDKLPSKRFLAAETGCSVITVQHAYDLLADEGYIEPRLRSGSYVIYREDEVFPVSAGAILSPEEISHTLTDEAAHGGSARTSGNAVSDNSSVQSSNSAEIQSEFPFSTFARTMRRVLTERGEDILKRSPNGGIPELRKALADYLARSRRINVTPAQIIVGAGSEYLYGLITQMLGRERIYALESPSYTKIRLVYEANGVKCDFLSMDREGVKLSELHRTAATVLHVTPFNSYPSGITASASRRAGYIRWVQNSAERRFIVEDDFDSEFTMSTKAEDTLFSLEPERSVIYMNTFSRTIAPSIRVGYMVLPARLCDALKQKISFYSCTVPVYTQYVLADFIRSGDFERHINRVRRHRRQAGKSS